MNVTNTSASSIARQTLLQLAKSSLPPTPENYAAAYNQIANNEGVDTPSVHKTLQKVLEEAGKLNPKLLASAKAISSTVKRQDWPSLEEQLHQILAKEASATSSNVNWSVLIRSLLKQLETSHKGITLTRKKDGLNRVLTNFAKDPAILAEKIQALMRSWGSDGVITKAIDIASPKPIEKAVTVTGESDDHSLTLLRDMMVRTLDLSLIPLLTNTPELSKKADSLLMQLRSDITENALIKCAQDLKSILLFIDTDRENQHDIHQSLIDLIRLTSASMAELVTEDAWLSGQIEIVNDVLSKPITVTNLENAKSSLKELIHKQSNLKPAMTDAQELLKQMAATFIARLAEMTESTDEYHQKIEAHQQKLTHIEDIDGLNSILKSVLDDTRSIGLTVQRSREAFHESQSKVNEAEEKIQELTSVLEYINEVANEDYLTGTLNRRGMDEALAREFSRADRHNTELCVAMMDIDHFKKLNDSLGHSTGDEALTHFANVIKEVKRSTDVLARYGGEEFLIILPNTVQKDGIKVIERVQRTLTKKFFMHSDEHIVITFSAGVAQRLENEIAEHLIPRADAALYEAKSSGRNRVLGAKESEDLSTET